METTIRNRAAHLTLRLGLAGLGLLLWHAPSLKAQECCPDQYTAAELAKMEASTTQPVNLAANHEKQIKPVLLAQLAPSVAPATKASTKSKANSPAKLVAVKQPVKNPQEKE